MKLFIRDYINKFDEEPDEVDIEYKQVLLELHNDDRIHRFEIMDRGAGRLEVRAINIGSLSLIIEPNAANSILVRSERS